MKKIITLVCTIACVFGLTACEEEVTYTQYEQQKIEDAIEIAVNDVNSIYYWFLVVYVVLYIFHSNLSKIFFAKLAKKFGQFKN